ncbi:MAG TPA: hypothetical protein VGN18_06630 [Jatrophihabitans sp.]|jgi:hypothetical protein|uniref:hypothetical protein n=1 Tax=Jatrophihabitans sp. TaxID=1932789 RepID=UPI002E00097F|nr:hypothetical protein [Jatrophihabitans sp.]
MSLLLLAGVLTACSSSTTTGQAVLTRTATVHATVTATAVRTVTVTAPAPKPASSASAPDFSAFLGPWSGHTRQLAVSPAGVVTEAVSDGCCSFQYDLVLQLSNPSGPKADARADAVVLSVNVFPDYPKSAPKPPNLGDKGSVSVKNGVFTDSFFNTTFCDDHQSSIGTCGA